LKNQRFYINSSLGQLNFFLIFCFREALFCRVRIINPDFLVSNGSPEAIVLARIGDDDHVIIKIVVSLKLLVEQEKRFYST